MQVPVSWLKTFVDIDVPIELLAEKLHKQLDYVFFPPTLRDAIKLVFADEPESGKSVGFNYTGGRPSGIMQFPCSTDGSPVGATG